MKTCTRCGIEKEETEFRKTKSIKCGLDAACKVCKDFEIKKWKEKNREKYLAQQREYALNRYNENIENERERCRKWRKENVEIYKESNRKSCKKSYAKFKEKRLEYAKLYRILHAEEKKQRDAAWRLRNPEKIKEYGRRAAANQRRNEPHKVKARQLVSYAVEIGVLTRPMNCAKCNIECKPEGHHPDYSKPLDVIWLCRECHNKEHGK